MRTCVHLFLQREVLLKVHMAKADQPFIPHMFLARLGAKGFSLFEGKSFLSLNWEGVSASVGIG